MRTVSKLIVTGIIVSVSVLLQAFDAAAAGNQTDADAAQQFLGSFNEVYLFFSVALAGALA